MIKSSRKNKKILSILSICLVSVCFFVCGCAPTMLGGDWIDDLNGQLERGEITQEEYDEMFKEHSGGIKLDGIKVLRHAKNYDFASNTLASKDYYLKFSEDFFTISNMVYGIVNDGYSVAKYNEGEENEIILVEGDNIFDALHNISGNEEIKKLSTKFSETDEDIKYFYDAVRYQIESEIVDNVNNKITVTGDLNKGWKWINNDVSFAYNVSGIENYLIGTTNFKEGTTTVSSNKIIDDLVLTGCDRSEIESYYTNISSTYKNSLQKEDYAYALGYVIYTICLGKTPVEIGWVGDEFKVNGYEKIVDDPSTTEVDESKSSAQVAFEESKGNYETKCSFVGLSEEKIKSIKKYILENVIGNEAVNSYKNLYYTELVSAMVDYCCAINIIGESSNNILSNLAQPYLTSEIVDYPSTSFFVSQNENDEFEFIKSYEYQSILIMPSEPTKISDIWLDFKYLAKNGNALIDNSSLYLDIAVSVNWWTGTELKVYTDTIRVYNNKFDPGEEGSTMLFEFDDSEYFGEPVSIGQFSCEQINVASHHDTEKDLDINFDKLTITGNTDARLYYDVVQGNLNGTSGYGAGGKLNQARISEEYPNKSYLEISFDVLKSADDQDKNYDFYVGFSQFNNYEEDTSWVK